MALFGLGGKKKKPNKDDAKKALEEKRKSIANRKAAAKKPSAKKPSAKKPAAKAPKAKRPSVRKAPSSAKRPSKATKSAPTSMPSTEGDDRKIRKSSSKKQIGQLLLKASKINQEQLDKALKIQARKGGLLGQILSRLELITKADVGAALRKQRTITTVPLTSVEFDPDAMILLPREFCEKNRLVPFEKIGNQICIAMSNALDTTAKGEIKDMTQMQVKIFDAAYDDIMASIKKHLTDDAVAAAKANQTEEIAEPEVIQDDMIIELPDEEIIAIDDPDDGGPLIEGITAVDASDLLTIGGDDAPAAELADPEIIEDDAVALMPSVQTLQAIPIPEAYYAAVVENGILNNEKRWLTEHVGDCALPAEPIAV